MHSLLKRSSKFSSFMLLLLALPLMLEAPMVLKLWLGIVPEHTVNFLRLILCSSMITTLSYPLVVSVHATGDLKRFQLVEGTMLLSIVPIAYMLLKLFGIKPEYVFCVHIIVELFTQFARMKIVLPMIAMRIGDYLKDVVVPILKVVFIASVLPLLLYVCLDKSITSFFIVSIISMLNVTLVAYCVGCTSSERKNIKSLILSKIARS